MPVKNILVKRLKTQMLIEEACALLYKEYIKAGSWIFTADNPTGLKIITKDKRELLIDRITPYAI